MKLSDRMSLYIFGLQIGLADRYTRFATRHFVEGAEKNYRRTGICSLTIATDYAFISDSVRFEKHYSLVAPGYAEYLPRGWEIKPGVTVRKHVQLHAIIISDPSRQ